MNTMVCIEGTQTRTIRLLPSDTKRWEIGELSDPNGSQDMVYVKSPNCPPSIENMVRGGLHLPDRSTSTRLGEGSFGFVFRDRGVACKVFKEGLGKYDPSGIFTHVRSLSTLIANQALHTGLKLPFEGKRNIPPGVNVRAPEIYFGVFRKPTSKHSELGHTDGISFYMEEVQGVSLYHIPAEDLSKPRRLLKRLEVNENRRRKLLCVDDDLVMTALRNAGLTANEHSIKPDCRDDNLLVSVESKPRQLLVAHILDIFALDASPEQQAMKTLK